MKSTKKRIVRIIWRDSRRYTYQMETSERFDVCEIETVGFLVKEDKKQYVLCQDLIDDDVRGVIVIPKENVVKITPPKK